jgi:adenosylhomocysteine nucleosidase
LSAFDAEAKPILEKLEHSQQGSIEGIGYVNGKFNGRDVVVSWTGIGKVNAAATTTLLIEHFRPQSVIVSGIAGAINPQLSVGDVVIGEKCVQHDLGLWSDEGIERRGYENRLTGEMNPTFFIADANLIKIAERATGEVTIKGLHGPAKVKKGVIATGDTFITSPKKKAELLDKLGADAVEMEGAAIAQICYQRGIPCIVIRGISDAADEKAVEDVNTFQNLAIRNATGVVCKMAELIKTKPQKGKNAIRN